VESKNILLNVKLFIGVLHNIINAAAWHLPEGKRLESCFNHSQISSLDSSDMRKVVGKLSCLSSRTYIFTSCRGGGGMRGICVWGGGYHRVHIFTLWGISSSSSSGLLFRDGVPCWLNKAILEIIKPHYFVLSSSREIVSLKIFFENDRPYRILLPIE
jgi:hypothetical protein